MRLTRPTNRPRPEIEKRARQEIQTHGGASVARVFYKFDCGHCGTRCFAPEPNVLPEVGSCTVCGAQTRILGAGFALNVRRSRFVDWDSSPALVIRPRYASDRGDA